MDTFQNLIVPTQVCSQCGLDLPLTNFGRDKQTKTGRLHKCRSCRSDDYYGDHEKNLGYRRERRKRWNLRDTRTPEQKRVHATFQNAVRVMDALTHLLAMLQPPADAAVREAVRYFDDLRGEWSDEQLEVHLETLLDYARAETPRLTREQKESALHLLSEMDKMLGEDMQPDDERPAALAMQRFCAAFPELGE